MKASAYCGIVAALAVALMPWPVHGQGWPAKPIRLIVPFPPGGGGDQLARLLSPRLGEALGQPVVVDNKPGAGGGIGTAEAARSAADGYTFVLGNLGTHAINAAIYPALGYDIRKDFVPVSHVANVAYFVVVHPGVPANTLAELVALAKSRPGTLNYGSGGIGTVPHLGGELFRGQTGTDIVHVPYKGGGPMLQALVAGETQLVVGDLPTLVAQVRAGKLRAIAMTSDKRSALLPDVPSTAEAGYPGLVMYSWQALFAPAGTPAAIVDRMSREVAKVLALPEVREKLSPLGFEPVGALPGDLASLVERELVKWTRVARDGKIQVQ